MFGSPETTTGGKALKFYASVRLDVRRIETLKDGTETVGNRTRVKVVKNKVAPPFKQAEFDILYGQGISREGSLIDVGVEQGIIRKSGAWYTYEGDQLGQGKENARTFLRDNPDLADEIEKQDQGEARHRRRARRRRADAGRLLTAARSTSNGCVLDARAAAAARPAALPVASDERTVLTAARSARDEQASAPRCRPPPEDAASRSADPRRSPGRSACGMLDRPPAHPGRARDAAAPAAASPTTPRRPVLDRFARSGSSTTRVRRGLGRQPAPRPRAGPPRARRELRRTGVDDDDVAEAVAGRHRRRRARPPPRALVERKLRSVRRPAARQARSAGSSACWPARAIRRRPGRRASSARPLDGDRRRVDGRPIRRRPCDAARAARA